MTTLTIHDLDTTPADSKELLAQSLKTNGIIPGLHGVMANAPGLLEGYQKLNELFVNSSFDNEEITVVWQTIRR